MNLNLVQFSDLDLIGKYSEKFKDNCVIACASFADLKEFNSKKRKSKTKIFSCLILEKKDHDLLQKFRKEADFVAVRGGSIEMNSWAANKGNLLLLQPFGTEKNSLDLSTCNLMRQNNVTVVFLFTEFLKTRGFFQSQLFKNAMFAASLLEKAKVPFFVASGALKENELRAAKDLVSFLFLLGLKKEKAVKITKSAQKELGVLK